MFIVTSHLSYVSSYNQCRPEPRKREAGSKMVGLTASALLGVMNPVLIKLTVLLGKEFEKFKDVRKKIADLQDELGSMKTALEMVSESEEAKPAAVYSSDLKRAAETAQMIAATSSVSNV